MLDAALEETGAVLKRLQAKTGLEAKVGLEAKAGLEAKTGLQQAGQRRVESESSAR